MTMQPKKAKPEKQQGVVRHIAIALGETDEHPISLIKRIVKIMGKERALVILAQTQEIEARGGMFLPDGSRKRTPGGVFFKLVRDQVTRRERSYIYYSKSLPQDQSAEAGARGQQGSGEQPDEDHSAGRQKDTAT